MSIWQRFRRGVCHAFAIDPESPALSEDDGLLLQKLADAVVRRRLDMPAVILLESSQPLSFLGSQVMHGLRPFFDLICKPAEVARLAHLLERRDTISRLIRLIHARRALVDADSRAAVGPSE